MAAATYPAEGQRSSLNSFVVHLTEMSQIHPFFENDILLQPLAFGQNANPPGGSNVLHRC
jgi:hypothetical protein